MRVYYCLPAHSACENLPRRKLATDADITFSRPSMSELLAEICVQTLLSAFFLLSSDTFVTLRWVCLSKSHVYPG